MNESIVVIDEDEVVVEQPVVVKEDAPRRSTRSTVADASIRRRRSVEPVRYAQLQEEDRAMARLKYAQQTQFRKGEKRTRPSEAGGGGGGGGGGSGRSSSKRTRAEERRSARQARRREALSPSAAAQGTEDALWSTLPTMALDGSGPQSLRFTRPADAVVAVVAHSTAWRRLQLCCGGDVRPPTNMLPLDVLTPFADDLDRPLESYDDSLTRACEVRLRPAFNHHDHSTDEQLTSQVERLLADATPRVATCHATRVAHVLTTTRQRVRACLALLPPARLAAVERCRAHLGRTTTAYQPLETVVAARQRENVPPVDPETDADEWPTYYVGRGETTVRETGCLPKEPLCRLPSLPHLSRSTTCIGVNGALPVDDDPIIRTVPVFSTATTEITPTADSLATSATLSALDDDRQELVLRFVVNATHADGRVFQTLRSLAWAAQPQADYTALQIRAARARVATALRKREDSNRWRRRSAESTLASRLHGAVGDETTALSRRGGQANDPSGHAMLSGFRALFCRRCFVYNCQFHGIHQPVATARIDPMYPAVKTSLRHEACDEPERSDAHNDSIQLENLSGTKPVDEPVGADVALNDETGNDDDKIEIIEVRRSVRSVTAAVTKASTLLVAQTTSSKKIRKPVTTNGRSKSSKHDPLADPSEYLGFEELYRKITSTKRTAMLQRNGISDGENDSGCSSVCYKEPTSSQVELSTIWTSSELQLLSLATQKVGSRPCVIAHLLETKNCAEVHAWLTDMENDKDELQTARDELHALCGRHVTQALNQVASARGNTQEHLQRTRLQRMKDRGSNHQYVPCHHATGESCNGNDCSCMRRDHFCEKACGCPPDCSNRFPGCHCAPGACGTMACPCYFSGRECDPDVCRSCGACEVPLLVLDSSASATSNKKVRVCPNTNLQRWAHRKVGVAESTTHGWGAYALEPIGEGEFIYEYTGELLSQDEAERRGNVYDRNAVSFLFDLNEDAVVDAARKGNKSKFANHSSVDPNCAARIMLVRGDHRIGLYAKRAIAVGEELFFDYGHHGVVPDWSQSRIRSSGVKGLPPGVPSSVENSSTPSSPRHRREETSGDQASSDEEVEYVVPQEEKMTVEPAATLAPTDDVVDVTMSEDDE